MGDHPGRVQSPFCLVCGDPVTVDQSCTKYPDGRHVHYVCKPFMVLRGFVPKEVPNV